MKYILLYLFIPILCLSSDNVVDEIGPRHQQYRTMLKESTKADKPILLYFTGQSCKNIDLMNEVLHTNSDIISYIEENYLLLELDVTERTPLAKDEMYKSTIDSNWQVKTIGQRNADLEMTVYDKNVQPYLVVVNHKEDVLAETMYIDSEELLQFLKMGVTRFRE